MQRLDSAYCDFAQHDTLRYAQNDDVYHRCRREV